MTDQELRARVQKAVNHKLSGVQDDPWLAQRAINRAEEEPEMKRKLSLSLVFALVGILLLGTALAAAIHTDFFGRVFGNTTRDNVEQHVVAYDNGKGGTVEVIFPEREYVEVDAEAAEALIGDRVMDEPMTVQIKDHTLTILSAVRDETAMAMEMTLERTEGENALIYDQLTNESKGAYFSDDTDIYFGVERAPEMIWVDRKNSTDTCLHLYYYCLFFDRLPDGEAPQLVTCTADGPLEQEPETEAIQEKNYPIPVTRAVKVLCFGKEGGEKIELSPFSLKVTLTAADNEKGDAMAIGTDDESDQMMVVPDPNSLKKIEIVYEDGSVYTVLDQDKNIDNTIYMCGGLGEEALDTSMVLNRLVDTGKVNSIRIDGEEYRPQN